MRTIIKICFHGGYLDGGLEALLKRAHCGPDVTELQSPGPYVQVTLEEPDDRITILRRLLKQHERSWEERGKDYYTEEELSSARLLLVRWDDECDMDWVRRMRHNWSEACRMCGSGGRQTSAMSVKGEELSELDGRRARATHLEHLLVDDRLAVELERTGATGLFFRNVYALMPDKRRVKLQWKQLCADRTLPPMAPRTTGLSRDGACWMCQRNWYVDTSRQPLRIVYRASDLREVNDVNLSWEHMGFCGLGPIARDCALYSPWTLVTPRVRRVFRDAGVTAFDWIPVRVEDDL